MQYYFDTLLPRVPVPIMRQITSHLERLKLPTSSAGVTGTGGRHTADDTARRPPSVKASLSVSFGQRAPHRASTRDSSPVRRNISAPRGNGEDRAEREKIQDRDRDRDSDRRRDYDRYRGRDRDGDRPPRESEKEGEYERSRDSHDPEIVRRKGRERGHDDGGRDRDHDRGRTDSRDRDRDRDRDRVRDRDRDWGRDRDRDREIGRRRLGFEKAETKIKTRGRETDEAREQGEVKIRV